MGKTANIIGATGLVGKQLVQLLLDDERYERVRVFVRRSIALEHEKLEEHVVDFERFDEFREKITGDELFSAMGTTLKQAGSKKVQYRIDYTYQFQCAQAAADNGVKKYVLVSAAGANEKSLIFYSRIKGELESAVKELNFERCLIFQPSLLLGEREQNRLGEKLAAYTMPVVTILPGFKKYRGIQGNTVAKAMINAVNTPMLQHVVVYQLDEIFALV